MRLAERQQVDAAVAVLGEVADGELAAVAGAQHAVVQLVGEGVQRGHAQARLEVGGGEPVVGEVRAGRPSGLRAAGRRPAPGRPCRRARRSGARPRRGVVGVLRVAVAGHDDAQGVVREGALGEGRDHGGVDAAGEAEHGAGAAGAGDLAAIQSVRCAASASMRFRSASVSQRAGGVSVWARRPPAACCVRGLVRLDARRQLSARAASNAGLLRVLAGSRRSCLTDLGDVRDDRAQDAVAKAAAAAG